MIKYILSIILFPLLAFSTLPLTDNSAIQSPYYVGELGARWQFPSDHLPVGATINDLHFVVWNTLNTEYLYWIETNSQGLKDSQILTDNVPISKNSDLTRREDCVVNDVLAMVQHPTHPRSVVALQELSGRVFRELSVRLPEYCTILPENADSERIEDLFIYDNRRFDVVDQKIFKYSFAENTIVILTLHEKQTGVTYKFIQSHVPGGPNSADGRIEFAERVMHEYNPAEITILLGDMNAPADLFLIDFDAAAKAIGLPEQPFHQVMIPYPTHVDTKQRASWIDHIFIAVPNKESAFKASQGSSELFDDLQPIIDLLQEFKLREIE